MEKDYQIGAEAKVAFVIADGKVRVQLDYAGKQASAGSFVSLDIEQFAALLKAAIPGQLDDAIIDMMVAAMKAV